MISPSHRVVFCSFLVHVPADEDTPAALAICQKPVRSTVPIFFLRPLGHDGKEKFVARVEDLHHLLHDPFGGLAVDRDAAQGMEQNRKGPEK